MKQERSILVIEDSDEDYFTLRRVLKKHDLNYPLTRCKKGEEALELFRQFGTSTKTLSQCGQLPSLILLDLNIIGIDGRTVLATLKKNELVKQIPIVVYTTSSDPQDVNYCYANGANSYILKVAPYEVLGQMLQQVFSYWFHVVQLP